jgi:putative ABC transport system ATP-binding protein
MDLLEQINKMGTTIVLVTHDPQLARRARRNVHVIDGRLLDMENAGPGSKPAPRLGSATA